MMEKLEGRMRVGDAVFFGLFVALVFFSVGVWVERDVFAGPRYEPYADGAAVLDVHTGHICEPPEVNQVPGVPTCGR